MRKTVRDLVIEYFLNHEGQTVKQADMATWVQDEYRKIYGTPCQDPWREARKLYQEGMLIKEKKGYYKCDSSKAGQKDLPEFSAEIKEQIFRRDNYRCVVCGRGRADGVEIHADHIKPLDKGGTNTLENGQTLSSEHNLLKKNYSQTEAGKRYFIRLYEQAVARGDKAMIDFCRQIFDVYNHHQVDRHIPRPNQHLSLF